MIDSLRNRWLTLLLAMSMAFFLLPVPSAAEETETTVPASNEAETTSPTAETEPQAADESEILLAQYQGRIEVFLNGYLKNNEQTYEEIQATVAEMGWDTYQTARWELHQILDDINTFCNSNQLSEAQYSELVEENSRLVYFETILEERNAIDPPISTYATGSNTHTVCESIGVSAEWYKGDLSGTAYGGSSTSGDTISAWAKSLSSSTHYTTKITLTNNFGKDMLLSLAWTTTNCDSGKIKISGNAVATSGETEYLVSNGGTLVIEITSKSRKANTTLSLSVAAEEPPEAFTVTLDYDSNLGSVSSDKTITNNQLETDTAGFTLSATPNSGVAFLGWINPETGMIYNPDSSTGKYTVTSNTTFKAVFTRAQDPAWFKVDEVMLFNNLSTAVSKGSKVVLAHDGVLTGTHEIPSGVTLLIPFDSAHTLYTSSPKATTLGVDASTGMNETLATPKHVPKPFRTLKMQDGAKITVKGALSVSGKHCSSQGYSGSPIGPQGYITMESGTNITVASGGTLYAWGYITGVTNASGEFEQGTVTIESKGTVYELFQVADWRGGSGTSDMLENSQQVFPMSQYYVQNVEVPLTLKSGAKEVIAATINALSMDNFTSATFLSNDAGLFRMGSDCTITKDYDEENDRLVFNIFGTLTMGRLKLVVSIYTMDSTKYVLPLNNNISVIIKSGANVTISQHMALLPGVYFEIEEGANVSLGEVQKYKIIGVGDLSYEAKDGTEPCEIYIYDVDQWGGYTSWTNSRFMPVPYSPTRQKTRTDITEDCTVLINGTVDASKGTIYTTSSGANIISTKNGKITTIKGSDTVTYQAEQYVNDSGDQKIRFIEIPITPAKLKNENGTYLQSASNTYNYAHHTCEHEVDSHGVWYAGKHELSSEETPPTCITEGYTTYTCTCGHSYTANETDFADHTPADAVQENVKKATCLEPGSYDSVIYCSVSNCGAELSRTTVNVPAAGHSYENGVCKVCGCKEVSFTIAHNLALKELVQIGYWVKAESAAEIKDVGILIWKEADYFAEDQHDITSDTAVNPTMTSRQGFMMGYGEGIYAQYLDTKYYAVPYAVTADGSYVYSGIPDVYAAPTYAQQMGNQSDKVKTVVRDLLNYGTYAQLYFDIRGDNEINTTTRINDVLTEEQKQLRYDTSMLVKEITANKELPNNTLSSTWRYSTVDLLDAIQLNFHAVQSNAFDKMLYWNKESYDSADILTADNATTMLSVSDRTVNSDLCTSASISNIYPRDMDKWHYACMYSSTDNTYGPLRVDSIACYLSRMIDKYADFEGQKNTNDYLLQTCKAMLAYGDSAKTYAGQ